VIVRALIYFSLAALLVGGTILVNRQAAGRSPRVDVDPDAATNRGPAAHERLGTHCLVDPDLEIQETLRNRQDYSGTHQQLGDKFYARGQYRYALDRYQRAVELAPDNLQALYGLGLAQTKLGRLEEARATFEKILAQRPNVVKAHLSLGLLDYREGNFAQAEKRWRMALKTDPENEYARSLLRMIPTVEKLE